ncbi:MAG: GxxExxY protein [Spirochaetaceae bacterium]|jgi:GxxExxY protein|nr:GxxExxY protein [Spirochaetaceae bacterium]
MITQEQEKLAKKVLDCAYEVHSSLGPGLLESTYQTCLQYELKQQGIFAECEKVVPVLYKGCTIDCGYRIDMVVERGQLIIENKSVKALKDIHLAQILTYMRLSRITLGFLLNFNVRHLKEGIQRVILND